jgi:hypothetical protein
MNKGKKFYVISCHVLWREISYFASISDNSFNFKFLKQGLHDTPDLLRVELQKAIDEVDQADEDYDAILVGYGLCSNGVVGISSKKSRLVVMKGHDCITFLLGSKERYQNYFDNNPGTYWYSPGWIDAGARPGKEGCEQTLNFYIEKYGEDNGEYLMEMEQGWLKAYSNAAFVDLGFLETAYYKEFTKECAQWLGWKYDELRGEPKLMRDFVNGNWNSEGFLIVKPGQRIIASNDERILDAEFSELEEKI